MANKRDEREDKENKPKIQVVDRRMLSEEEREGRGAPQSAAGSAAAANAGAGAQSSAPPKLEIVGGHGRQGAQGVEQPTADDDSAQEEIDAPLTEPASGPLPPAPMGDPDDEDAEPLSAEEQERMVAEVEQEQFAAIEQQMGRPLTEQEKDAVRAEMDKQARSMASLEVTPLLAQLLAEMSARAAVHMGLMPNPYTRLIAKNDAQARLAIDAFAAVFEVLKPQLNASDQREYARVLNDLRLNFVSATGIPSGGPTGSPAGGPSRLIH